MAFDSSLTQALADMFEHIGKSATFTPQTGTPVELYVDYVENSNDQPIGFDATIPIQEKTIEYVFSDIGREAKNGETFTINGVTYTVQNKVASDGYTVTVAVK
jgi:hypothetical protein